MDDTFQILARFLDQFTNEVQGRELGAPPEEAKARLLQLARGELPPAERKKLLLELVRNSEWLGWLAQEVKAMRQART